MERKFNEWDEVTILGTDGEYATVGRQATNSDLYYVHLHNPEAVYPYEGRYRVYPEWMLEEV